MTNSDTKEGSIESGQISAERNLSKEFNQASEIGRSVLNVARERSESPRYQRGRYTFPMLDMRKFPRESVVVVNRHEGPISEEDLKEARVASAKLVVEAAVQIVGAKPISRQIADNTKSLGEMERVINRGLPIWTPIS